MAFSPLHVLYFSSVRNTPNKQTTDLSIHVPLVSSYDVIPHSLLFNTRSAHIQNLLSVATATKNYRVSIKYIYRVNIKYIYRVSIKSFPDYKHLLQENYVEYKYTYIYIYIYFFSKCNSTQEVFFTTH